MMVLHRTILTITRLGLVLAGATLLGGVAISAQPEEPIHVLRRIRPLETVAGVVAMRDAFEVPASAPAPCEDGTRACEEDRRFPRVISLEFAWEQTIVDGELVDRTRDSRGAIQIALHFDDDQERAFVERLRGTLAGLSAASFTAPFAGQDSRLKTTAIADRSIEPCFICYEHDDSLLLLEYSRKLGTGPDGRERVVWSGTGGYETTEQTQAFCRSLAAVTAPAHANLIRTVTMPRLVESVDLRLEVADLLPSELFPEGLTTLPAGATTSVSPISDEVESVSNSWSEEQGRYESERVFAGEIWKVTAVPAELPRQAAADRCWIGRWRLQRTTERLGELPSARAAPDQTLLTVLMPTVAPQKLDANGAPLPVADVDGAQPIVFDQEVFVSEVARQLDLRSSVTLEAIEEIVTDTTAGLGAPAWILAVCREDGTAGY